MAIRSIATWRNSSLCENTSAGVGRQAAQTILAAYPGRWQIAVARANTMALAFWRRSVAQHPLAYDVSESDLSTPSWNGPVIRLSIAAAAGPAQVGSPPRALPET